MKKTLLKYLKNTKKFFWKHKKKTFFLLLLLLGYCLLFFYRHETETYITFPWAKVNLKQITNHPAGIINAEEIDIVSSSGDNIHGIFIDSWAEKTVYYFHGNGAPMDHFYTEMRYIASLGYNLISYDFPGYGKSEWVPYRENIQEFSEEFYAYMKKQKNFKDSDVIIWGYSVGTAVAVDFTWEREFDRLVLVSPLSSRYDMSRKIFGFAMQKLMFLPDSYVSKETIRDIHIPTLIVHGNIDIVVPFSQGRQVFKNSGARQKSFIELDDMGHSLIIERYGDILEGYFTKFFAQWKLDDTYTYIDRKYAKKLLSKVEAAKYIKNLDLDTDASLTKFVNPDISFTDISYVPEDMESLDRDYILDTKWNAQMRPEAKLQFEKMAEEFYKTFDEKIRVVSSYRSYQYQAGIKARGCPDNLCAKAGYSEHQSGLTVDLWSASNQSTWESSKDLQRRYIWLSKNAHLYGFHNTYQKGKEIDGYEIEPWHWRYLGIPLATYLKEQDDMTFAEFYYQRRG